MTTATPPVAAPPDSESSAHQPRLDTDTAGMYYDIDAALLGTFRLQDNQLHTTWDDQGQIVAAVELTRPLPSLAHLTQAFYRFWGQVCLERSEIHRQLEDDAISFWFRTGSDRLDYRGVVTFRGEPVQALLRRLRASCSDD